MARANRARRDSNNILNVQGSGPGRYLPRIDVRSRADRPRLLVYRSDIEQQVSSRSISAQTASDGRRSGKVRRSSVHISWDHGFDPFASAGERFPSHVPRLAAAKYQAGRYYTAQLRAPPDVAFGCRSRLAVRRPHAGRRCCIGPAPKSADPLTSEGRSDAATAASVRSPNRETRPTTERHIRS